MKQTLLLLSVLAFAACGTASTEVKTDSTTVAADTTAIDTTVKITDTVK
jgi:phage baseplate assembly protein gpV